jgi:glyoxylase-like metal-dependent hydrolase (beta-lactamase superfamily II)
MQTTMVPGVATWSRWQADRAMFFNAWFVIGEGGNFVVDPLEPDADDLAYIDERGLAAVVITNRDHERAAALFAARYAVPVIASLPDANEMGVAIAQTVAHGERVYGWRVVGLDGFKTAGEFALFDTTSRSAITGDAFWGVPAGALRLMPDEKLADPARPRSPRGNCWRCACGICWSATGCRCFIMRGRCCWRCSMRAATSSRGA